MSDPRSESVPWETFLGELRRRCDLDDEQAEKTARATLRSLRETLSEAQSAQLAAAVPGPLQSELQSSSGVAKAFDRSQFLALVADAFPQLDHAHVETRVRVTLQALRATAAEQAEAVLAELPPALAELAAEQPGNSDRT